MLVAPFAVSLACSETFQGCEASRTCPPKEDGGGDSGAGGEDHGEAGAGGEPAGGTGGSGGSVVWSSVREYTAASERWSPPAQLFSLLEYGDDPSPSVAFAPNGVGAIAFRYRVDRLFESQVALFE